MVEAPLDLIDDENSERALGIGDPAPALAVEAWLTGEPLARLTEGRIYVIEFWAVWCSPCLASISLLTEIQREHPQVRVIGVAERYPDVAKVRAFVAEKRREIGYAIALQAPGGETKSDRGQMSREWLDASASAGIPTVFLIDGSGKIAWIGPPANLRSPLVELLEDRFDVAGAIAADRIAAEQRRAKQLLFAALEKRDEGAADPEASFAEFDALASKYPEIARSMEHIKLFKLGDKAAMVACGKALLAKARGDRDGLILVGASLLNASIRGDGETPRQGASDPEIAALGVEALFEAEPLARSDEQSERSDPRRQAAFWFQFHEALSRGLAGIGRLEAARSHTMEAVRLGKELQLPADRLARMEAKVGTE